MKHTVMLLASALLFSAPMISSAADLKDEVRTILKENPSIIIDVINDNPSMFMRALQNAAKNAKAEMAAMREKAEQEKIESAFKNPLKANIRDDEAIRGTKNAPLVIVEYSDFECPYCAKGNKETIQPLLKKYEGKIQLIYKHLPLSFHRNAKLAAQYYEAIRMQSNQLAFEFHDQIFENARKIKQGEKFLKAIAKTSGVNMSKLTQTLKNKINIINARIKDDMDEAAKFDINGTPGFLVNGVPVKGAYPLSHFENIIQKLQQKGMLKL